MLDLTKDELCMLSFKLISSLFFKTMQVNGGPQLYHLPRKFSEILFDVKISKIDTLLSRPYKSRDIIVPKLAVQQPPN